MLRNVAVTRLNPAYAIGSAAATSIAQFVQTAGRRQPGQHPLNPALACGAAAARQGIPPDFLHGARFAGLDDAADFALRHGVAVTDH